jgi:hypothetical protein
LTAPPSEGKRTIDTVSVGQPLGHRVEGAGRIESRFGGAIRYGIIDSNTILSNFNIVMSPQTTQVTAGLHLKNMFPVPNVVLRHL